MGVLRVFGILVKHWNPLPNDRWDVHESLSTSSPML